MHWPTAKCPPRVTSPTIWTSACIDHEVKGKQLCLCRDSTSARMNATHDLKLQGSIGLTVYRCGRCSTSKAAVKCSHSSKLPLLPMILTAAALFILIEQWAAAKTHFEPKRVTHISLLDLGIEDEQLLEQLPELLCRLKLQAGHNALMSVSD